MEFLDFPDTVIGNEVLFEENRTYLHHFKLKLQIYLIFILFNCIFFKNYFIFQPYKKTKFLRNVAFKNKLI